MKNFKKEFPQAIDVDHVEVRPLQKLLDPLYHAELFSSDYLLFYNPSKIHLVELETLLTLEFQFENLLIQVKALQPSKNQLLLFTLTQDDQLTVQLVINKKLQRIFRLPNTILFCVSPKYPCQSVVYTGENFAFSQFARNSYRRIKCLQNQFLQVDKIELSDHYLFVLAQLNIYCLQLPNGNQVCCISVSPRVQQVIELGFQEILIVGRKDVLYVKQGNLKYQLEGELEFQKFKNESQEKILIQLDQKRKDMRIARYSLTEKLKWELKFSSLTTHQSSFQSENGILSILYNKNRLIIVDELFQIIIINFK